MNNEDLFNNIPNIAIMAATLFVHPSYGEKEEAIEDAIDIFKKTFEKVEGLIGIDE